MYGWSYPGSSYFGGELEFGSVTGTIASTQAPNTSASIGDVETGVHGFLTWEKPKKIKRKRSEILARKTERIRRTEIVSSGQGSYEVKILPSLLVTPEGKVVESTKISDWKGKPFEREIFGRVEGTQKSCISSAEGYIGDGEEDELMLILSMMED